MRNQRMKTVILIILFGIILFGGMFILSKMNPKEEGVKMTVHYYDKNFNEIKPEFEGFKGLSKLWIVGVTHIDAEYFSLSIKVTNTGNLPITATINSATNSNGPIGGFFASLPVANSLTIPIGQDRTWESCHSAECNPMRYADYIGNNEFKVWVHAIGTSGAYTYDEIKESLPFSLNIQSEGTVIFRTSSLIYDNGANWIAYYRSELELSGYGYVTVTSSIGTGLNCDDKMPSVYDACGGSPYKVLSNLPGGWKTGGASPSLWKSLGDDVHVCVCDDNEAGYWYKHYSSNDPDSPTGNLISRYPQTGYEDRERTTGGCVSNIQCGVWGECVSGTQSRTCTDLNGCVSPYDESQTCTLPVCGNSIIEPPEVCDLLNLGTGTCANVMGTGYIGNLACLPVSCAWDTSGCTTAQKVIFRTYKSDITNLDGSGTDAIAFNDGYATTCTSNPLTKLGEYSTNIGYNSVALCSLATGLNLYIKMFDIPSGINSITTGSNVATHSFAMYYKSPSDYVIAGMNDANNRCLWTGFRASQTSGTAYQSLSDSPTSTDPTKESNCP